jgi:prepilin-type N-terminal cleavage/methylation domain-containing protein
MKLLNQNKGLTLIEIIVAIAILGIILVPLIGMFTNGFTNIFTMGNKTRAVTEAQAVLDFIYSEKTYDPIVLTSVFNIDSKVDEDIENSNYNPAKPIYYSVIEVNIKDELFNKVTVLVFYQKGKRYITLSALIP